MAKKYPFSNERREGFGNLSLDPKKISGKNSKTTVVVINVAVNSQNVDRDGDVIGRTDFYGIKLFGRDADLALTNLEKGDRVHFKGRVFPTEYVNRDDELVESVEINADMGEVYPAPLWKNFDTTDDEDDDRPARRSRKSSKRKATKRRKQEEEEAQDWDDDEDLDEDLDDDFEEDAAPKRPTRSRSRSRSRKKSSDVDVDDDADEYEDLI